MFEAVKPTQDGQKDAASVILEALQNGEYVLLAPDGRMWQNKELLVIFATVGALLGGEKLEYEGSIKG